MNSASVTSIDEPVYWCPQCKTLCIKSVKGGAYGVVLHTVCEGEVQDVTEDFERYGDPGIDASYD